MDRQRRAWSTSKTCCPRRSSRSPRQAPVLLLVLDGMSAANAAEIIASVLGAGRGGLGRGAAARRGPPRRRPGRAAHAHRGQPGRPADRPAGRRRPGRRAARLCSGCAGEHGIASPRHLPQEAAGLLPAGPRPARDVASAIADVTRWPLVTCVLNTIDDALDRADPGGTEWTAAAVRHLLPLLDRARYAGRTVILTADHGHVVERRQGTQRSYQKHRAAVPVPAADPPRRGRSWSTGGRVVLHGGRAVLAVDERVRFGPLKAGYHGGATPAEAVVPVAVLVAGGAPEGTGLRLAPPQEPAWWADPVIAETPTHRATAAPRAVADRRTPPPGARPPASQQPQAPQPTLFDLPDDRNRAGAEPPPGTPRSAGPGRSAGTWPRPWSARRLRSAAPDRRPGVRRRRPGPRPAGGAAGRAGRPAGPAQAAIALAVAPVALRGAILHVQRLLNVEGYPVLRVDADGATVILDEPLLREQFGLGS